MKNFFCVTTIFLFMMGCAREQNLNLQMSQVFKADPHEVSIQFGNLDRLEVFSRILTIINDINEPVQVKDVNRSCGCLSIFYDQDIIQPGNQFEINVQINPKDDGHYHEQVSVVLENKTQSTTLNIAASAAVDANIKYSKSLVFENNPYQVQEKVLPLQLKPGINFTVYDIEIADHYSLSLTPNQRLTNDTPITITRNAVKQEAIGAYDLTIHSTDGDKIEIKLIEQTYQDIRTKPDRLFFMLTDFNQDLSQTVLINPVDIENFCEQPTFEYDKTLFQVQVIESKTQEENSPLSFEVKVINPEPVINQKDLSITINCGQKTSQVPVWVSKI